MSQLAEKTWEEELKERFLREGKSSGEASGEARAWREALQTCLRQRFQTLPDELLQRIMTADADRLKTAFTSAFAIHSLEDLEL